MISFGLWADWEGFLPSLSACESLPWRSSSQSAGPQTTGAGHCHHHRAKTRSHCCVTNPLTNITSDALQPATSSQDCNDVGSPKGLHGAAPSRPQRSAIKEGQPSHKLRGQEQAWGLSGPWGFRKTSHGPATEMSPSCTRGSLQLGLREG